MPPMMLQSGSTTAATARDEATAASSPASGSTAAMADRTGAARQKHTPSKHGQQCVPIFNSNTMYERARELPLPQRERAFRTRSKKGEGQCVLDDGTEDAPGTRRRPGRRSAQTPSEAFDHY